MKNKTLKEIKAFAVEKLEDKYDYCNVADNDDFAKLSSMDQHGNGITIKIEIDMDERPANNQPTE